MEVTESPTIHVSRAAIYYVLSLSLFHANSISMLPLLSAICQHTRQHGPAHRHPVGRRSRAGIDIVGKERFTYLYSPTRDYLLVTSLWFSDTRQHHSPL